MSALTDDGRFLITVTEWSIYEPVTVGVWSIGGRRGVSYRFALVLGLS